MATKVLSCTSSARIQAQVLELWMTATNIDGQGSTKQTMQKSFSLAKDHGICNLLSKDKETILGTGLGAQDDCCEY